MGVTSRSQVSRRPTVMLAFTEEIYMRTALAALASIVTACFALPALAQGNGGCPPGLAAKGCLPPGQAKKMAPASVSPPLTVYQPPVAYVPVYSDPYRPSGASMNIGVTVPLP